MKINLLVKCYSATCLLLLLSFQTKSANLTEICNGNNLCVLDFESGQLDTSIFSLSGDANWSVSNFNTGNGSYTLHSPDELEDSGSASITLVVNSDIATIISFNRRVSSERFYDHLEFYIDGNLKSSWSGKLAWSRVEFEIVPGENTFKWQYTKDSIISDGLDKAWIDNISFELDSDLDGMTDRFETDNGLNPNDPADASQDADDDGLNNLTEYLLGTMPNEADSDGDGMDDFYETSYGLLANNAGDRALDLDGDGLSNEQEFALNTRPDLSDTDGDGLSDSLEIELGANPNDIDSDGDGMDDFYESSYGLLVNDATDSELDLDGDGLSNEQEFALNTRPDLSDTDEDGLSDYQEVNDYGTSPLKQDTDSDNMPDGYEIDNGLNPNDHTDARTDIDNDNLTNVAEYRFGTLPNKADSDDDGMDDFYETSYGLLANDPSDAELDLDGDGLSNEQEFALNTRPNSADTDDDGLGDYQEVNDYATSPVDADTDHDGLSDRDEIEINTDPLKPDTDADGMDDFYETTYGLLPGNANDAGLDLDQDGLTNLEEFIINSNPILKDTDLDGSIDSLDKSPLSRPVFELNTITSERVSEIGVFGVSLFNRIPELKIYSGDLFNLFDSPVLTRTISWSATFRDDQLSIHLLKDINGNGAQEVGVFGMRGSGTAEDKPQFLLRDSSTGERIKTYNWSANWNDCKLIILDDMNGDGVPEVALQGLFNIGNRPQLVVKDGATASHLYTFSFPDGLDEPEYIQLNDMNGDGVTEIGLIGKLRSTNQLQVRVIDGADPESSLTAYNFGDRWDNPKWVALPDLTGDGFSEWGLLGKNKLDGRIQLVVKNGTTSRGVEAIYSWPADLQDIQLLIIPDMNDDGINEIALGGRDNKYRVIVKSGANRSVTLARKNWPERIVDGNFFVVNGFFQNPSALAANAVIGLVSRGEVQFHLTSTEASKLSKTRRFSADLIGLPTAISETDINGYFYTIGIEQQGLDNVKIHQIHFPR